MTFPIAPIHAPALIQGATSPVSKSGGSEGFASALNDAMGTMQDKQQANQSTIDKFLSGENQEVHQVALQAQQTQLQFEMFMAVRNKIVQAYQEVMRMQM